MEYVPGTKIDNIEVLKQKYNTAKIAAKLVESYLVQILNVGLIHLDCHFSNLAISGDGKLVFYDYGMFLDLNDQLDFKELLLAIYSKNVDKICKICVDQGFICLL